MAQQTHWIGVTVTFGRFGVPIYTFSSLLDPTQSGDIFRVGPGEQVAWKVRVIDNRQNVTYPAYEISFASPLVFGVSTLSVPGGGLGYSPFLQAVSLDNVQTKYTLTVSGVHPPVDPAIVIDNTGNTVIVDSQKLAIMPPTYEIYWDSTGTALKWRTGDSGHWQMFPMPKLVAGKIVNFLATPVNPAVSFSVLFGLDPDLQLFSGEGAADLSIPGTKLILLSGDGNSYVQTGNQIVNNFPGQTFSFNFGDVNNPAHVSETQQLTTSNAALR